MQRQLGRATRAGMAVDGHNLDSRVPSNPISTLQTIECADLLPVPSLLPPLHQLTIWLNKWCVPSSYPLGEES